ncbi:LysR family transcriptional regulator [Enterocloster aldenensis]|uniref:LysR family transcriptional regulator n=1 Tax=Enterocloster aldenensis TaxID=358742 RepID=UPI0025A3B1CD|nr:LysR family transcriptional regulator [Enterocloster aldenensis]
MTEREIEAFLTIVRTGSISAAAEVLYVTQPALSRRIRALEQELGYQLFIRKKGLRNVGLTAEGKAFISLAERWKTVWNESRALKDMDRSGVFHIGSVGSVGTYLMPMVLERFMEKNPDCSLNFHQCHSFEGYKYVEDGSLDLALVSDDMFSQEVLTVPAFKGKMVLAVSGQLEDSSGQSEDSPGQPEASPGQLENSPRQPERMLSPSCLDPEKEIRLPWNPEYDTWHDYWFGLGVRPRVMLNQMSLMEYFLREKGCWVIAPEYIARMLKAGGGPDICGLQDGPAESVIYYLVKKGKCARYAVEFLEIMKQVLGDMDGLNMLI